MINPVRKHIRLSFITFLLLFFAVSFLIPQEYSYAHKVQMFAHVEGSKVFVEGYFADGKKAKNSEVTVFDNKSGERLLGGKTDDMGKFSFNIPKKTDLRISLNASLGHKTEQVLPGSELPDAGGSNMPLRGTKEHENNPPIPTLEKGGKGGFERGFSGVKEKVASFSQIEQVELQVMIEKGIEKGISPLLRGFSECKERVYYSEIIGGIGYIFGIMGIALYFKARKNQ